MVFLQQLFLLNSFFFYFSRWTTHSLYNYQPRYTLFLHWYNLRTKKHTQWIDINIVFNIKQDINDVHKMHIQKNHAECKMQNLRSKILSRHMFSFYIVLLVILFPIKLLTEMKQLDFNKPKVRNWIQSSNWHENY